MATMSVHNETLRKISNKFADGLLHHRILILIFIGLITLSLGYVGLNQRLVAGFDKSIPQMHPYMETLFKYRSAFGGSNRVTLFVEDTSGNMFNAKYFTALGEITKDVLKIPSVDPRTVTSLFTPNVNYVSVTEDGFMGAQVVPSDFVPDQKHIEDVKYNLTQSTEIGKTVAKDLSGALVIADIVEKDPTTGRLLDYQALSKTLDALQEKYQSPQIKVHMVGFAPFTGAIINGAEGIYKFFIITLAITFGALIFFSGSWKLATATILTALVSVVWQLGLVRLLGYGVDPLSVLVPFLILSIGVSHAVQMTSLWRSGIATGHSPTEASRNAIYLLLIPGATALIADAVGFGVIMIISIPIIKELGITASIGVAVMLITNKVMLPIALSFISFNEKEKMNAKLAQVKTTNFLWQFLMKFATPRYAVIALAAGILVGVFGYTMEKRLIVGDLAVGAPEFWSYAPYNKAMALISKKFSVGMDELVVIAEAKQTEACVQYPVLKTIDDFVWAMKGVPGVHSIKAVSEVLRSRNVGNYEANPKFLGLPYDTEMIASNIGGMQVIGTPLYSSDCKAMPITLFLTDHKSETLKKVIFEIEKFKAKHDTPDLKFSLAMGNAGIMAATNDVVASAQLEISLILFGTIGIFCYLTFLSWRATLCALVPLVIVSLFANAVMVALDIGLKVSTLPVLALGVGVGVDYSIYLIARMQAHLTPGTSVMDAYGVALNEVGAAVVFTAITMSVGVATWAWSDLKFQADMGILLAYMFFVNMVGATVLMPAVAYWTMGKGIKAEKVLA